MIMRCTATLLLAFVGFVPRAQAVDLIEAWHAAQEHDLEYCAARASHDAGLARRSQGTALWRPSVTLSGTAGKMSSNTQTSGAQFAAPGFAQTNGVAFNTSINEGNASNWAVSARQPLLSGERLAQSRQLELAADLADMQWQAARQALMLRTVERYFDVALAQESLRALREQQDAVDRALAEARERYRVGDIPITATHEATARSEAIRAQVLAAQTDLELKQQALSDITGLAPQTLRPNVPAQDGSADNAISQVQTLQRWLDQAAASNLDVRTQAANLEVARQEAFKSRAASSPSLDLVAKVGRDHLAGNGDFGPASTTASSGMIGVQLTVPVFTGGYRSAQHEEAVDLAEKLRADEQRARQQVALQTRAAWLGLTVGAGRVAALSAALDASRARLDATRLGQQVGDRTTLDLLNAEADASSAEMNLLQARIGLLTERLHLAALAGALDEDQLKTVNANLQAARENNSP